MAPQPPSRISSGDNSNAGITSAAMAGVNIPSLYYDSGAHITVHNAFEMPGGGQGMREYFRFHALGPFTHLKCCEPLPVPKRSFGTPSTTFQPFQRN